jgi:iron complex outermembrane receptor protein
MGSVTFVDMRAFGRAHPGASTLPACPPGAGDIPNVCFDYSSMIKTVSGQSNLYSPELSFNLGVEYEFQLGNATLTPRLNYAYVGKQWAYIAYDPATDLIDAYGLWNALVTYKRDAYSLDFYATNLTDETYISGQYNDNEFYGTPRQFGIKLRVSY